MKLSQLVYRRLIIKQIVFVIFCLTSISAIGQTNEGTEFWLSFMEHRNPNVNTKVVMITSRVNTSGTISAPLLGFNQAFTVSPNQVTLVELPANAETIGSEFINNNGYRVTSNDLISVYIHQYHAFRAEATLVLPKSTIDNSYYALSYTGYTTFGETYPSEFLIVANEDQTTVTITLAANTIGGRANGTTFDILLNAGETYQIQGAQATDDLSGSFVRGDKPFSLFCGNRYSALNCFRSGRDNLLEQAFPISTWGTRFVSAPFQNGILDVFRILASEDNTSINILFADGSDINYTLDQGEFLEYEDARVSFIESNKPILIAQYMNQTDCANGSTGDPSMLYLNSVLQIRDTVTMYNSMFENIFDNYISIITRSSDLSNVFFDGQSLSDLSSDFVLAGPNNEYAAVTLRVNSGSHTIASAGCGVIAKAFGLGDHESYAYSGGASFNKINASPIPDGGCRNDSVFFATELPEERFAVSWVLDGQDTIHEHEFFRIYQDLGSYDAQLFIHDQCFDLFDTLQKNLLITSRQSVSIDTLGHFCTGDDIHLSATDVNMATYEWRGPLDFFEEVQSPIIPSATTNMSGSYEVIGIVSGCATFPAFVDVEVKPLPLPDLGDDAIFCPKFPVLTEINPGNFDSYQWEDGSIDAVRSITEEGEFQVTVTDSFGCEGVDSISFVQRCPTDYYVPNIFSPNKDQVNDEFGLFGEDVVSFDLRVYDRWGSELFRTTSLDIFWDGNFNGEPVNTGAYAWLLDLVGYDQEGAVFQRLSRGTVTLIR